MRFLVVVVRLGEAKHPSVSAAVRRAESLVLSDRDRLDDLALRAAKALQAHGDAAQAFAVTRICRPSADADHHAFLEVTRHFRRGDIYADTVAAIPGRWSMVAITGPSVREAIENLDRLESALRRAGLVAA